MQRVLAPCEVVWSNAQLVPAKRTASLIICYPMMGTTVPAFLPRPLLERHELIDIHPVDPEKRRYLTTNGQRSVPATHALARWHHSGDRRTSGSHRSARRCGAETKRQADPLG